MGAPKGNKFAVGNKGGSGSYNQVNREKAVKVKGMTLDYLLRVLQGTNEELKEKIVLKIANVCFPTEISGVDGEAIKFERIDYDAKTEKEMQEFIEWKKNKIINDDN